MRRLPIVALILAAAAHASGPESYTFPSTPFSPPKGFLWMPLLFLGLFTIANTIQLRRMWGMRWGAACGFALSGGVVISLFTALIYLNTHPWRVHHAAWGSSVFWGVGFRESIGTFVAGNVLVLLLVLGSALILMVGSHDKGPSDLMIKAFFLITLIIAIAAPLSLSDILQPFFFLIAIAVGIGGMKFAFLRLGRGALPLMYVNLAVFLVSLAPFALTGAYLHGYTSHWYSRDTLTYGWQAPLVDYLLAHHGRLPAGRTLEAVAVEVRPYLGKNADKFSISTPPLICPSATIHERQPHPYAWNPAVAGKTIEELRALNESMVILSCPYHSRHVLTSAALCVMYDDPSLSNIPEEHLSSYIEHMSSEEKSGATE